MPNADQIIELFNEAKAYPAGPERERFLAEACGQDVELREQIVSLIEAESDGRSELFDRGLITRSAILTTEQVGDRIGRYKLLENIGEGGCGVVYMAEQVEPVRRRVALKVIKLGMDTRNVIARFEAERQALAMMDHPNIAKVFDGGATETGRPYFVMELVRGTKITDFCDQNSVPIEERLRLFMNVCEAIQHAHLKGIIHRDIKPSNILVSSEDGKVVPKVIDFGIAKATEQSLTDKTIFTAFEQFIGTPAYMSPEQAERTNVDIDTRSDIYSLGVLLYELLTSHTPFDSKALIAAGVLEVRRIIRESEPPKPSDRLSTLAGAELTTVAGRRLSEPPKLLHRVRGDLDWIVMKCLEKERTRRYETANSLAADLKRHLANEPVEARPPSRAYQFRKLVRRNKLAFTATAAVFCALVLGIFASTLQLVRARNAEREQSRLREVAEGEKTRAQNEALKSEQVAKFLTSVFTGANPFASTARDRTLLIEIVDRASTRIDGDLAGQLALQAELKHVMGSVYDTIGEYEKSERLHRESLATMRTIGGTSEIRLATSIELLSNVLRRRGANEEAESLLRECLAIKRRILSRDHDQIADTLRNLAWALTAQGKGKEAEAVTREGLDMRRRLHGNEHALVADSLWGLSENLAQQHRWDEAESAARQSVAMLSEGGSAEGISMALQLGSLAWILGERGKTGEAIELERKSLAMREKFLGFHHPWTLSTRQYLVELLELRREYEEAEGLLRKQLAEVRALGPDRSSKLGTALYSLANILRKRMKLIEARALAEEAVALYNSHPEWTGSDRHTASRIKTEVLADIGELAALEALHRKNLETIRASLPADHSQLAVALASLSRTLLPANKFTEAEPFARECLDLLATQTSEDWITFDAQSILGGSLLGQKNYTEAEPLLLSAYEGLKTHEDKIPLDDKVCRTDALQRIVQFYQATGQSEKATEWSKTLTNSRAELGSRDEARKLREEVLVLRRKLLGPEHPDTVQSILKLADFYLSAGNLDDALKLREEALPLCRTAFGPDHANTLRAMERLADSKLQAGQLTEALTLLKDASTQIPGNTYLALKLATLQVWFAKEPDHATTTQRLLKWASETTDHEAAERVAKLACLRPIEDASVRESALAFARRAVELGNGKDSFLPYAHMVLGMAEYRSGHYPDADNALIEAAKTSSAGGGRSVAGTSSFYRAMSLFNQGRQAEAHDLFITTQAKMKPLPVDEQKPLADGKSNADDLILWLACKEARAQLNVPDHKQ